MADNDVKYTCTIEASNIEALRDALNFHDEPLTVEITSDTPIGDGSSSGGSTPNITVNDTDYELETIIESGIYSDYVNNKSLITYIKSDDVTRIISNAFSHCNNLTEIDFKNVIEVQDGAFSDCRSLKKVTMPKVKKLSNCFQNCTQLEEADFPELLDLIYQVFKNCTNLNRINFPKLRVIGQEAFNNCISLQSELSFPNVNSLQHKAFLNCKSLTTIILPAVTAIGSNVFQGCTSLTTINLNAAARERLEPNLGSYGIDTTKTTVNWV